MAIYILISRRKAIVEATINAIFSKILWNIQRFMHSTQLDNYIWRFLDIGVLMVLKTTERVNQELGMAQVPRLIQVRGVGQGDVT